MPLNHPLHRLCMIAALALLSACAQQHGAQTAGEPGATDKASVGPDRDANPIAAAARLSISAADLLEAGNEEQAGAELKHALSLDPGNKLALSLVRQMSEDPVARFGRESFAYVVHSGDTLSRIAGRFLGDIYLFHALARYNGIKVPRQVAEGQTLRIPGKAPAPPVEAAKGRPDGAPATATVVTEAPEASPAERAFRGAQAAEKAGNFDKAYADYKSAVSLGYPGASAGVATMRKKLVDIHSRAARSALARQNLDGAIAAWDRVLQLKPGDETAQLERQKVLRLKEALLKK